MKKLILILALCFITNFAYATTYSVNSIQTPDDVTIDWLNNLKNTVINALNDFDGSNIQTESVSPDAMIDSGNIETFRDEAFNDWVYSGLLPPTASGTLTSTTTSGTAYVGGVRVTKDATAKTYTATKWTFVDLSNTGTYTYVEGTIDASEPAVTANSIRLARVTTSGTEVTAVRDDRVLSISLGSNEDFYIAGFEVVSADTETITFDTGVLYHGSTRVEKTSVTGLIESIAANWWDGVVDSYSGGAGWNVIGCDSSGSVKFLGAITPNFSDIDGNANGRLLYFKDANSKYWRLIGAVKVNTSNLFAASYVQRGELIIYDRPTFDTIVASAITSATFADVDCSTYVPKVADSASFQIKGTGALHVAFRPNGSGDTIGIAITAPISDAVSEGLVEDIPLDSSQVCEFANIEGTAINAYVKSYRLKIR